MNDRGVEQLGEWHKASEVFLPDQTEQEKKDSWNDFLQEQPGRAAKIP
jgi:hypothetical protein